MPHVVFDQKIDLFKLSKGFDKIFEKGTAIIRIGDIYINKNGNSALLSAIVIEDSNQSFLIEVLSKEDKTTVRLFPGTDPEKTDGVKRSLGMVAGMIKGIYPEADISKTNIQDFIS